jgi:hypothetical protein
MKHKPDSALTDPLFSEESSVYVVCDQNSKIVSMGTLAKKHFPFLSRSATLSELMPIALRPGTVTVRIQNQAWIVSIITRSQLFRLEFFALEIGEEYLKTKTTEKSIAPMKNRLSLMNRNILLEAKAETALDGLSSQGRKAVPLKDLLEAIRRRTDHVFSSAGFRFEVLCGSALTVVADCNRLGALLIWIACFLLVNTDGKRLLCTVREEEEKVLLNFSCTCIDPIIFRNHGEALDRAAFYLKRMRELCKNDFSLSCPRYRSGRLCVSLALKCTNTKAFYTLRDGAIVLENEIIADALTSLEEMLKSEKFNSLST